MALRVDPFLNYIPRDNAGGGDAR
ncbi:MAG: hypothetical protein K0Q71_5509, partial [Thermomicrobiales bacterium]|nr:hypothetical protein [Thermomicrobiales bacterium]